MFKRDSQQNIVKTVNNLKVTSFLRFAFFLGLFCLLI
jgi:hypothetical protein